MKYICNNQSLMDQRELIKLSLKDLLVESNRKAYLKAKREFNEKYLITNKPKLRLIHG